ncbi:VOC family protein [Oleiharenicola lentus]|uniref:VOC family protein n=1 Tax=Oleiharenicola lentus TaxID=2508720 RepID=UPI003F67B71E
MDTPKAGTISWTDLTVPNAVALKDFYAAVAGWGVMPIDMGGYEDFCMMPPGSDAPAAGICHARGANADLPPMWLVYITVPDVEASVNTCVKKGGKIVRAVQAMGGGKMAVIQDPAGAIAALFQPGDGDASC